MFEQGSRILVIGMECGLIALFDVENPEVFLALGADRQDFIDQVNEAMGKTIQEHEREQIVRLLDEGDFDNQPRLRPNGLEAFGQDYANVRHMLP